MMTHNICLWALRCNTVHKQRPVRSSSTGSSMTNQLCLWDLTVKYEEGHTFEDVKMVMKEIAKAWMFQLERGESGYEHWQIRVSLYKKKRKCELIALLNDLEIRGFHISPTSNQGRDSLYCMKADTRIEGPWTDKDKEPPYVQKRFRNPELIPWQVKLVEYLEELKKNGNDRNIVMVMDDGGEGKSWIKGLMTSRKDAIVVPASCTSPNDMIQFVMSQAEVGGEYIILMDVPRGTSPKHWYTLAAGLETIKQGFLHDLRYQGRSKVIEPPQMCCFMNNKPPDNCMTSDVFKWFQKED